MRHNTLLFVTLITLIALTGCSNKIKTYVVTGTVTLDGKPLPDATVNFSPKGEGNPAYGITDAQGQYKLQTVLGDPDAGTTPGTYEVSFIAVLKPPRPTGEYVPSSVSTPLLPTARPKSLIPAHYENAATSGYTATVVEGDNVFNFELKSN